MPSQLDLAAADLIVANDVSDASIGFDSDQNQVLVISRDGATVRLEKSAEARDRQSHPRSRGTTDQWMIWRASSLC
ncbi:MAG TPA: hypothetical protein VLV78_23915 [Thermoanaerobaculia bacterium]|nr:hypothetical protein [Thermoanaerobaculia bacterium]